MDEETRPFFPFLSGWIVVQTVYIHELFINNLINWGTFISMVIWFKDV